MTETHSKFPTIFFQTEVDSNNFLKETLCDQMLEASKHMKAPKHWFTNNLKTSFEEEPSGFNIIEDNFSLLKKSYTETIGKIIKRPHEIDLEYEDIWYNIYQDGEFQDEHTHVSNLNLRQHHYSCIHFLSFNSEYHDAPVFSDPLSPLPSYSPAIDESPYRDLWQPEVKEGDLLMFPVYVPHSVYPCKKSDYPRITITFNFTISFYNSEENGELPEY